ncbi:MAG: YdiU family protein [Methylovulum sp.]|uniref:protein adenylyltransferase SelO n=1 Tax=Methylovulum sp. TaxID=1916980 RepID=UPI0026047283|nr:YdiU family protein [Methylovulum sp.]MDD2725539.1 YdiU family protein [Methylovulum sp.]MDD5125814.1 YdiU family protein [Methylovulum sp.]
MTVKHALDQLNFDNSFIRELPADTEPQNFRRQVLGACYSKVLPTLVSQPTLVAYSREVAELLDLTDEACTGDEFADIFTGNRLAQGMDSYASCYGGHQFGNWAGQLGDGRAINLGEVLNRRGERWTLQLKGAGPTPYSRTADGLAVLRSSVREFLCSEAMFHLGVPTTRALSLVLTGDTVIRDMFYDGNPQAEPGAVVCRVAPSFTRFGSFQIFAARGEIDVLKQLADYTIRTDFPHLGEPSPAVYLKWYEEICRRTAEMILHWQRVGFVHGVMNTDNMSILGLTIDYGPYGWLENYDLNWTPNTTDAGERRYRYGNQPSIAFWNLGQLANAIFPLLDSEDITPLQTALNSYKQCFAEGWQAMMAGKLGLQAFNPATDHDLCTELLTLLQSIETDMTIFFRRLAWLSRHDLEANDAQLLSPLLEAYYLPEHITPDYQARMGSWLRAYLKRVHSEGVPDDTRRQRMDAVNPKYVLRNYLAQLAIDQAEQGDFSKVTELLELLRHPYDEQPDKEDKAAKRPDWARQRAGCSMLSCSS